MVVFLNQELFSIRKNEARNEGRHSFKVTASHPGKFQSVLSQAHSVALIYFSCMLITTCRTPSTVSFQGAGGGFFCSDSGHRCRNTGSHRPVLINRCWWPRPAWLGWPANSEREWELCLMWLWPPAFLARCAPLLSIFWRQETLFWWPWLSWWVLWCLPVRVRA